MHIIQIVFFSGKVRFWGKCTYIYYNGGRSDRLSKNFNYTLKIIVIKYPFSEYYRSRKDKYINGNIVFQIFDSQDGKG